MRLGLGLGVGDANTRFCGSRSPDHYEMLQAQRCGGGACLPCSQLLPCHAVPDQVMGTVYKYIIFHGLLYALPLYQSEQDTKHARDYLLCSRKLHSEIKLLA